MKKTVNNVTGEGKTRLGIDETAVRQIFESACTEFIHPSLGDRMVTIGFTKNLRQDIAVKCLEHVLVKINRAVFGKMWSQKELFFQGVVIVERKRLSLNARGSPHFHCLLRESVGARPVNTDRITKAAESAASTLRTPTLNHYEPFGKSLSGKRYVDVTEIYDPMQLSNYLAKEFRYQKFETIGITIGFIGIDGVTGLTAIDEPGRTNW